MKHLFILLTLTLTGCSGALDVTPRIGDISYTVQPVDVFNCVIETVDTDCIYGPTQLYCNPADLMTYEFDTGAARLNADSTPIACTTATVRRFNGVETDKPLFKL